jgi:hypothetical protein
LAYPDIPGIIEGAAEGTGLTELKDELWQMLHEVN